MGDKLEVRQGTLALMVLKTLEAMGPLHGYGLARRIEQTSGARLAINYGTIYPALLKLEQEGHVTSEWGLSDNNRRAKYYRLTRAGPKQLEKWGLGGLPPVAALAQRLPRALRMRRGARGSAAVAMLCWPVGVGANPAMSRVVTTLPPRPLPPPEAARLHLVQAVEEGGEAAAAAV